MREFPSRLTFSPTAHGWNHSLSISAHQKYSNIHLLKMLHHSFAKSRYIPSALVDLFTYWFIYSSLYSRLASWDYSILFTKPPGSCIWTMKSRGRLSLDVLSRTDQTCQKQVWEGGAKRQPQAWHSLSHLTTKREGWLTLKGRKQHGRW